MSTFAELKAELAARGFDYLTDARQGAMVNRGMRALDGMALWPYLENSATGLAPLAISDLGTVEAVLDTTNDVELAPSTYQELLSLFGGDLSTSGNPTFWYRATPGGVPTVATYAVSTSVQIGVQYFRTTAALVNSTDVPLAPARWHDLVVDLAAVRAYRDMHNHGAAESLQAQVDRDVAQMRQELFTDQVQGPGFIQIRSGSDDS